MRLFWLIFPKYINLCHTKTGFFSYFFLITSDCLDLWYQNCIKAVGFTQNFQKSELNDHYKPNYLEIFRMNGFYATFCQSKASK
jgi:hypothetical protein